MKVWRVKPKVPLIEHIHVFDSANGIEKMMSDEYRADNTSRIRFDNVLTCECGERKGYDDDKSDMSHLQGSSKPAVLVQS